MGEARNLWILLVALLANGAMGQCPPQCPPPGQQCQVGSQCGVGVGVNVGRISVGVQAGLVPAVRNSCVVPVFVGTDPSPAAGVYVGVIRGRGVVLTCLHAARHGVRAVAGQIRPIEIYRDRRGYDMVAVLVPPLDVPPVSLGSVPFPTASVAIVGYPRGRFGRHVGRVTGYFRAEGGEQPWGDLSIDAPSQDGDSGGAVLDDNGNLVGLLWGTRSDGGAGSVAVPIQAIEDFLKRLEVTLGEGESPQEPITPPAPAPLPPAPIPVPAPPPELDGLRELIQQNAEAIAALAVAVRVPGPQGEPGPVGPQGEPGRSGNSIDFDTLPQSQIDALILRLPPIRVHVELLDSPPANPITEQDAYLGGSLPLRLYLLNPPGKQKAR